MEADTIKLALCLSVQSRGGQIDAEKEGGDEGKQAGSGQERWDTVYTLDHYMSLSLGWASSS